MCEESVTFLLECGMYALLFDPLDLETQARRIYELYIDDASEGRISGISAVISDKIKSVLEKANVLQKSDVKERKSTRRGTQSSTAYRLCALPTISSVISSSTSTVGRRR